MEYLRVHSIFPIHTFLGYFVFVGDGGLRGTIYLLCLFLRLVFDFDFDFNFNFLFVLVDGIDVETETERDCDGELKKN